MNFSVSKTNGAQNTAPNINKMPIRRIFSVLGFTHPDEIPSVRHVKTWKENFLTVCRYDLTDSPCSRPSDALFILKQELSSPNDIDIRTFDFVYNRNNLLSTIFPVIPQEIIDKIAQLPKGYPGFKQENEFYRLGIHYLDLAPYYFEVPNEVNQETKPLWDNFMRSLYFLGLSTRDFKNKYFGDHTVSAVKPAGKSEYVFLGFDSQSRWYTERITGSYRDFFARCFYSYNKLSGMIVPVFPTVYTPPERYDTDSHYMNGLYSGINIREDDDVLIVGPGCGRDAYVVSQRTKKPIHTIGINPFEVENQKATADIAGFSTISVLGDNIISADGLPVIWGKRFDWVIWNMPSYCEASTDIPSYLRGFAVHEDYDVQGQALRRFVKGLPQVLKPQGQSFIWNMPTNTGKRNEPDKVTAILRSGQKPLEVTQRSSEAYSATYLLRVTD
jgi:hypothetical protein